MNCTVHPESAATSYCRTCGRAMCEECKRTVHGVIYCEDCLATRVNQPAAVYVPPPGSPSPALATLLGFIPGVGAMYNGQFYKGLVHVAVFVGLVGLESAGLPDGVDAVIGMSIAFWYIYMIVDANRTAHAKLYGRPLPDPFGIERMFGGNTGAGAAPGPGAPAAGFVPVEPVAGRPAYVPAEPAPRESIPVGAVVLIALGVIFLLNSMGWLAFHWVGRLWPLILIGLGVWLLIRRFGTGSTPGGQ